VLIREAIVRHTASHNFLLTGRQLIVSGLRVIGRPLLVAAH